VSEGATCVIYLAYFGLAVVGACLTLIFNCQKGIERDRRHATIRFWSLNVCSVVLGVYFFAQFVFVAEDYLGNHDITFRRGIYRIESNDVNLRGFYVLQQVDARNDGKGDKVSMGFLLRSQFLEVGRFYDLAYGARSGYILTASPVLRSSRQ
jgi:hypothetical protein